MTEGPSAQEGDGQALELEPDYDDPGTRSLTGPVVLSLLAATAVVAAALVLPGLARPQPPPDLSAVQSFDELSTTHVDEGVDYGALPPVGGPHFDRWLGCGAYDRPVRDENAVHGLEHGVVWITYDPSLPPGEVERLERQLPDEGYLSPYPGLPAPVVVSVWGWQLGLDGVDDPRLALFLGKLGDGGTAPEPLASCRGGIEAYADDGGVLDVAARAGRGLDTPAR